MELKHTTRMLPKRREEVLDGGSLYWVIKGFIAVRQRLLDIRPFVDKEGVSRCHLVYDKDLVVVSPQPRRPFQGWRYFEAKDAPRDMGKSGRCDAGQAQARVGGVGVAVRAISSSLAAPTLSSAGSV